MIETPENKDVPKIPVMEEMCWTYEMRRNMQEVVPGLFLGPYSTACRSQLDNLLRTGITHIICIRQDSETQFVRPNFPDKFKYLVLNISLSVNENIIQHFSTVCNFITECLESGGKVLVHGLNGCCRSATLIMAYLMQTYNLNCEQAFNFLLDRRMCISPFERFLCQLKEFEVICRAQRDVHFRNGHVEVKSNKRSIEELAEDDDLPKEKRLFCNRPEEISSAMTPLSESEDLMDIVLS